MCPEEFLARPACGAGAEQITRRQTKNASTSRSAAFRSRTCWHRCAELLFAAVDEPVVDVGKELRYLLTTCVLAAAIAPLDFTYGLIITCGVDPRLAATRCAVGFVSF